MPTAYAFRGPSRTLSFLSFSLGGCGPEIAFQEVSVYHHHSRLRSALEAGRHCLKTNVDVLICVIVGMLLHLPKIDHVALPQ